MDLQNYGSYLAAFGSFFTYLFQFMWSTNLVGNITIGLFFEGVLLLTVVLTFVHSTLLQYRSDTVKSLVRGSGNNSKGGNSNAK